MELGTDRLAYLIDLICQFLKGSGALLPLKLLLGGGKFDDHVGNVASLTGDKSRLVLLVEGGDLPGRECSILREAGAIEAEDLRSNGLIDPGGITHLGLIDRAGRGDDPAQLAHLNGIPDDLLKRERTRCAQEDKNEIRESFELLVICSHVEEDRPCRSPGLTRASAVGPS